jgi:hypothetical protein
MTNLFNYTQKNYWGGSWYPYWTLMIATIIFGFFGGDHFWLRSPLSGLMKLIVNIFTLGLWYFYDLIQILGNEESVKKYGLSAPLFGPLGIGAGMFRDKNTPADEPVAKSPFRYLAYVILLLIPFTFGIEYAVAGDMGGAGFKFLTSLFFFILAPIGIIYTIRNAMDAIFLPNSLFEQGTHHVFPASFFLGPRGTEAASILGPRDVPDPNASCSSGLGAVFYPFVELLKIGVESVIAPAKAAVGAVSTAVTTTAGVVTKGAETASGVLDAVQGVASGLGSLGSTVESGLQGAVDKKIEEATRGLDEAVSGIGSKVLVGGGGGYSPGITEWGLMIGLCSTFAYYALKKWSAYVKERKGVTEETSYNGVPIPNEAPKESA